MTSLLLFLKFRKNKKVLTIYLINQNSRNPTYHYFAMLSKLRPKTRLPFSKRESGKNLF
jgi:hypothetical protein